MSTLALKLTVTPLLILAASLAIRRWGEIVGGWFVGLPLTSAPVCFFLALDQGAGFARTASLGSLLGVASEAAFVLLYSIAARRAAWPASVGAASAGFAACGFLTASAAPTLWPAVATALTALVLVLVLMPRLDPGRAALPRPPRWDIPARMTVATALILGLTALAPHIGARVSGLVATYPVFATVLAAFSHHRRGAAAAVQVLRGLLIGLFAFVGFFTVVTLTIEGYGVAFAFAAATPVALATQGLSLWLMRGPKRPRPAAPGRSNSPT
ncbi:MAG TPA: hypothetical protein VG651_23030 [Stellaceae bacterium]|nr:hypothetical protein [Stellaceae bacterium]